MTILGKEFGKLVYNEEHTEILVIDKTKQIKYNIYLRENTKLSIKKNEEMQNKKI